jgi:hypothetical protein
MPKLFKAANSGTKTVATPGTPETLLDVAIAGIFKLYVDTSNMVAGTILELRIYQMVLTGGTRRVGYLGRWEGVQPANDLEKVSRSVWNELTDAGALRFEINQTKGAAVAFAWKVLRFG